MKKVLVTGGCGFIGSHTMVDLIDNGFEVISIDNLSNSDDKVLEGIEAITGKSVQNYEVDLCDLEACRKIFGEHKDLVGIIHFAAFKSVGESVDKPLMYFQNNLNSLLNMLSCAKEFEVNNFIFSSSCSVYGNTTELPVTENTALQEAECPYARTKQMGEKIIQDFAIPNTAFKATLLRYFNPAGAHESGLMGESPINVSTNLVPVITEAGIGKRKGLSVNGSDFGTRDGSCVRDYIHVMDIGNAHTKAVKYLMGNENAQQIEIFNLGIGEGVSVLECINAFEKVSGVKLNVTMGPRRAGDVEAIYANPEKASTILKWTPTRNIDDIMRTAWVWEQKRSAIETK